MESLTGRTLLVVEDEFLILLDLQYTLEEAGARVVTAGSVAEGLAVAAHERLDAAVLDVRLPDGEVFPLAEALRERGIPLVFHSGHAERTELKEHFPSAIALSKPAPELELVKAVARQAVGG